MLVDPDDLGPRVIEFFDALAFEDFVIGLVDEPVGAAMGAPHAFEIDKVFTSPVNRGKKAFSVALPFLDAWNGFREGFLAGFTPEPSFTDDEQDAAAAHGRISDRDLSMIVGALTGMGAPGTELSLGDFLAEPPGIVSSGGNHLREFQLWQKHEV